MNIEIESNKIAQCDFSSIKKGLIKQAKKFDSMSLRAVPYHQLTLCCIGTAGQAMCSPELVKKELKERRKRYINLDPKEFKESEIFLKIERMDEDVLHEISTSTIINMAQLNKNQIAWARLVCLFNHLDNPAPRIQLALEAFNKCIKDKNCPIPSDICVSYATKLEKLGKVYPDKVSDVNFRNKIYMMASTFFEFMSEEEKNILDKEQIKDFNCTSDCFRV